MTIRVRALRKEELAAINQCVISTTPTHGKVARVQGALDGVFGISYTSSYDAVINLLGKLGAC